MKKLFFYGAILAPISIFGAASPALAQAPASVAAPVLAKATLWAQGFKEAQGLALDLDGNIAVADAKAGEVVLLSKDGARLKTLANGLKTPTMLIPDGCSGFLVAERGANRVVALKSDGKIYPYLADVVEPIGLWSRDDYMVRVVSHTTSQVFEWTGSNGVDDKGQIPGAWRLIYKPADEEAGADRYGFRCLVGAGDALFFTDETEGTVWMRAANGFVAPIAKGLGDPSGLLFGNDGALYVADESEGGRLWKVGVGSAPQIVAQGLGRPRGLLFLDEKTLLVSSRDGKIWKVAL